MEFARKLEALAEKMAEVYFNIFIFENQFRRFIEEVSIKSYGEDYWDTINLNKEIKQKISARKKEDLSNKWLSFRGDSNLFYMDLIDLKTIISSNWDIFQSYFPKENWIITYLEDLYKIRNKVAHNILIDENERITVQSIINNIYKQLDVNRKYVNLFKETTNQLLIDEIDYEEEFSQKNEEQSNKFREVDFNLIFNYLEMIEKGEIPDENLRNTFHAIDREIQKVSRIDDISPEDIMKFEEICKRLLNIINIVNERFEYLIIGLFYSFTFNDKTSGILETHCYSYLTGLFEHDKFESDLISILDKFGYFNDKFEEILLKTIKNNGIERLNIFIRLIDFSRYRDKRIDIIRKLNQMLLDIDPSNLNLKEAVKSIIRKFE